MPIKFVGHWDDPEQASIRQMLSGIIPPDDTWEFGRAAGDERVLTFNAPPSPDQSQEALRFMRADAMAEIVRPRYVYRRIGDKRDMAYTSASLAQVVVFLRLHYADQDSMQNAIRRARNEARQITERVRKTRKRNRNQQ